ncbi:hypothetical protein HUJ04_004768 [Dendroctonus ponderosae]|nr:hypothetical protein HUJ04_004768 [Dendroctonus ponderosae]
MKGYFIEFKYREVLIVELFLNGGDKPSQNSPLLPVPWLLFGIIYREPVEVNSTGMVCSITILFMMLLFVIMSIAMFRWRMNKGLGFTMFLLYVAFVAVSLMFEYKFIACPF